MKRSNIGRRIMIAMLIVAFGMGIVLSVFSSTRITNIYHEAQQTQDELSTIAENTIQDTLSDQTNNTLTYLVETYVADIRHQLIQVEYQVDLLADTLSSQENWDSPESMKLMESMMQSISDHETGNRMIKFASTNGIRIRIPDDITDTKLEAEQHDWYVTLDHDCVPQWSDAMEDSDGKLFVTCAESFNNSDNGQKGFISIELPTDELFQNAAQSLTDSSYAGIIVLNKNGDSIYCSTDKLDESAKSGIIELFKDLSNDETTDPDSDEYVFSGQSIPYVSQNDKYYVTCATISNTSWYYMVYIKKTIIDQTITSMLNSFNTLTEEAAARMNNSRNTVRIIFNLVFFVCAILVVLISHKMAKNIRQPLQLLAQKAIEMGRGNLDVRMDTGGDEEIAELGTAFNTMADDLQKYISEVQLTTQEQEKQHTEMKVAHSIQTGLLPMTFPAFTDDPRFDIYASMHTAREVGGDFYDFFKTDPDHLVMVIADVSGKGIPAALFMVVARTLIRDYLDPEASMATLLEKVNKRILEYNPMEMFVSTWIGIVDLNTGIMRCANAGHEYPIVKTAAGNPYELIHDPHGLVIGGMEDVQYREYTLQIERGGSILLYTDGVTEQHNENDELFGEQRTLDAVNAVEEDTPLAVIEGVQNAVRAYKGDIIHQFDDMTLMCWKRLT